MKVFADTQRRSGRASFTRRPDVPFLLNSQPGPLHGQPLAFAHRGSYPERENTMAAFERAVELGFKYLEIDVRTARCGTLVVFHDQNLDRVTNATGPLSEKSWEELSAIRVIGDGSQNDEGVPDVDPDDGEPLVRLTDLLAAWDDIHLNVDLKDDAAVPEFARLVEEFGAHSRVLAASFHDVRCKRLAQALTTGVATSGGLVASALLVFLGPTGMLRAINKIVGGIDCLQVPIRKGPVAVITGKFVARCHRAGMQVHVWTVNDAEQMHELLDLGVDGIMSDDPYALAEVMKQRSVWPQYVPGG